MDIKRKGGAEGDIGINDLMIANVIGMISLVGWVMFLVLNLTYEMMLRILYITAYIEKHG